MFFGLKQMPAASENEINGQNKTRNKNVMSPFYTVISSTDSTDKKKIFMVACGCNNFKRTNVLCLPKSPSSNDNNMLKQDV